MLVSIPLFTRLWRRAFRHLPADLPDPSADERGAPQPHTERSKDSRDPKVLEYRAVENVYSVKDEDSVLCLMLLCFYIQLL